MRAWRVVGCALVLVAAGRAGAEEALGDWARMKGVTPRGYVCYRAEGAVAVDGKLDDGAWGRVPWTDPFADIEGDRKPAPTHRTRAKMLWDDDHFYIAAELDEPHVWATLTTHDAVIFQDNDFEVFIDPNGDNHEYYELELNALNTTWDLFLPKPYKDGGQADNRWEIPGLKSAVHVRGTLNNPADRDEGWSIEIAIPWRVLREHARRPTPPRHSDQWRVDFSRVEWDHEIKDGKYHKIAGRPEHNWVWSPPGIIDMHRPERWGYVQFSTAAPGTTTFARDPNERGRDILMEIYHRQKAFHAKNKRYAATLAELGMAPPDAQEFPQPPTLERAGPGFVASLSTPGHGGARQTWQVRHDSQLTRRDSPDELAAAIETILYQQADAWNRGDIDAFIEHYWKSDALTFSSGGKVTRGWQATKDNYRKRYPTREQMGSLRFSQLEVSPLAVSPLGTDGALVLGNWHLDRAAGAAGGPVGGNFTLALRKINGRWVIVHDHTSRQEPSAATSATPSATGHALAQALEKAGKNRPQLEQALATAPFEHRGAMQFLIEHMPQRDLESLSADFLRDNVRLAHEARDAAPWKDRLPGDVFQNYVLPYACINESREPWRADFRRRFLPLVAEAKTPAAAAAILNQKIFPALGVRYSTKRPRADQSPAESIRAGTASCTGLSVLLIDACRSVGVPARFVGTPMWTNMSGNHSWVEVWDNGWHFTGAAEPTGLDLDRGWFVDRAATARRDEPRHAIYAVSFQRTPLAFPLVWDRNNQEIYAVNVTDRYVALRRKLPAGQTAAMFRVLARPGGERIAATLILTDAQGKEVFRGPANDESFDANDHRTIPLTIGQPYTLEARHQSRTIQQTITITPRETPWTIVLDGEKK